MEITKETVIGVLGAGTMGSGIAQVAAQNGHRVILIDNNHEQLEKAEASLNKILSRLVEKGRIDEDRKNEILGLIDTSTSLNRFKECGLVIEAIVENLDVKKQVFHNIEEVMAHDAIIATNTSSLSIASISSIFHRPERFLGIHFFNPAPLLPLVEIVPSFITDPNISEMVKNTMNTWGKKPVIVKDTPGFIVNRVARPFYAEALRIYEEGIADIPTIDWAMKEIGGFRMGPFELMDYIGHDVNYIVTETVFKQFYYDPRFKPSISQLRLLEAKQLGRKSGRGFYDYSENAENPKATENRDLGEKIFNRVLSMLINEAADAVFMNIASQEDIETAMTKGVNYPKGLLAWANEIGIENVVNSLNDLYEEYGEDRYRVNPLLRRMNKAGEEFRV